MLPIQQSGSQNCQSDSCECESEKLTDTPNFSRRGFIVSAGVLAAGMAAAPALATPQRQSYADALMKEKALSGYWRFDENLADAKKKSPARSKEPASFAEGAVEGKSLSLTPEQNVSVENTNHLRGRSATLNLFFQVQEQPSGDKDVVLIAQTSGKQVRYLVGIKNDLSALLYRNVNADIVTTAFLPTDQPIEVGRWYHLAITSFDLDLRIYVDGYECSLVGGAFEFTRRGPKKSVMFFGTSSLPDWGSTRILIDEMACFAKGLTQTEIQDTLKSAGWQQRLRETGDLVRAVKAKRDDVRAKKTEAILNDPELVESGKSHVYKNENLEAINFIVGGIGAGGIQFNGKAEPAIWQIACQYQERKIESFLAVRATAAGGDPVVRALQTSDVGKFPAMPSLSFVGEYPFATYQFEEPALPVTVELQVFNPFIPMDLKNSAIPAAIYQVKLTNPGATKVSVDVLAAQQNGLGYQEGKITAPKFGSNVNEISTSDDATLLHMTRQGNDSADMVLMTQTAGAKGCAQWDSKDSLYKTFAETGAGEEKEKSKVSPPGKTVNGALAAPVELAPGETKTVTFVLTWHFKPGKHGSGKKAVKLEGEGTAKGGWTHVGQNYTNWWSSAREVATYLQENLSKLTDRTQLFHDTLYASKLPVWLLDRLSSQLAVLRSQTCWWAADGYFGFWEGCNPTGGCCGGNCAHVWHYAQAHARLLPELGRLIRDQDFAFQRTNGMFPNRHTSPGADAADGHFGNVLNTYREHLCSSDNKWLKSHWPKVKNAMQWGMNRWDPDRDGFMQNTQHNTLDGAFSGCSSWIGTIYLAALEAAAQMADDMDEPKLAADYRKVRELGRQKQNERLWNGEYYVQEVGDKRDQDYLDGCHIDQLLGEWWAGQVGIEPAYPAERSRIAMESLLKYNFLADFQGQSLKPRQYCEIEDGGMKMITWPNDPQPIPGMKYGDEVMTGFEYSAAVAIIQTGLVKEGLMVIKTISNRYDGRLRTEGVTSMKNGPWGYSGNPFGDDECGKFYGRSLSVWSALIALQGFQYDGPAGRIGFKPRIHQDDHASFFSVAEGYGLFKQVRDAGKLTALITIAEGTLDISEVVLSAGDAQLDKAVIYKGTEEMGGRVDAKLEVKDGDVFLKLNEATTLTSGQRMEIVLS